MDRPANVLHTGISNHYSVVVSKLPNLGPKRYSKQCTGMVKFNAIVCIIIHLKRSRARALLKKLNRIDWAELAGLLSMMQRQAQPRTRLVVRIAI